MRHKQSTSNTIPRTTITALQLLHDYEHAMAQGKRGRSYEDCRILRISYGESA